MNKSYKDGRRFEKGDLVNYTRNQTDRYAYMNKTLQAEVLDSGTNYVTIKFIERSAVWVANAGMADTLRVPPRDLILIQDIKNKERNEQRQKALQEALEPMRRTLSGDIDFRAVAWTIVILLVSMMVVNTLQAIF